RRIVQIGLVLFMLVSLCWSVLFYTDTLQVWHAVVLLIVHGLSGVLWGPPTQVLIHDIVSPELLPSAVRLNASARYLGLLAGPAVGAGLMLLFGPTYGIALNAVLYLPAIMWLQLAPSRARAPGLVKPARPVRGLSDIIQTARDIRGIPILVSTIALGGAASFFIGNAYQAQMPSFANDLGQRTADFWYSALLVSDAVGALVATIVLESRGLLLPKTRTAFLLAMVWCVALAGFALTHFYVLELVLLFIAGFVELSFGAMVQTLVQLNAPAEIRGRVLGLFTMAVLGLRTFSGLTVGFVGGWIGPRPALAVSAVVLLLLIATLFVRTERRLQRGIV
ncbi:MAG: MFS transporter, partial [Steroidobacteraceae bacterium]